MSIQELTFTGGANEIEFCDERERAGKDVSTGAFVSVTLSGHDTSWGEFMGRNDALALRAWLDLVLGDSACHDVGAP